MPVNRWSHAAPYPGRLVAYTRDINHHQIRILRLRFSLDPNTEIVGELDPVSFNEDSKEPIKRFGSPGPRKTNKLGGTASATFGLTQYVSTKLILPKKPGRSER